MKRSAATLAVLLLLAPATALRAEGDSGAGQDAPGRSVPSTESLKKAGNVFTFYGLRKLEEDPQVPDDEKLKEWQAFIERATEQIQYARKAAERWKNAAKLRALDTARTGDRDPRLDVREKIKRWKEVARLYGSQPEGRSARKRLAHWAQEQTRRLVEAAEEVERSHHSKLERIRAWREVIAWSPESPEARTARRRVDGLEQQLFNEAQSVDSIARVDDATKLAAWRDVLAGHPAGAQEKLARRRVRELEAALGREGRTAGDADAEAPAQKEDAPDPDDTHAQSGPGTHR